MPFFELFHCCQYVISFMFLVRLVILSTDETALHPPNSLPFKFLAELNIRLSYSALISFFAPAKDLCPSISKVLTRTLYEVYGLYSRFFLFLMSHACMYSTLGTVHVSTSEVLTVPFALIHFPASMPRVQCTLYPIKAYRASSPTSIGIQPSRSIVLISVPLGPSLPLAANLVTITRG